MSNSWRVSVADGRLHAKHGDGIWNAQELIDRERSVGIRAGSAFLTAPDGSIDPILTRYFNSASFTRLAESSRRSYVDDYRTFFNFLWASGELRWNEATTRDVEDYEDWRRRAMSNPRRISGAKWIRELAALKRLYDWAIQSNHLESSPIRTVTIWRRDGTSVEAASLRANDVRHSNVKWLTPQMARRWRDVGLVGQGTDGQQDPSFRGRLGDRNAAYFDLLFDSGLRRTEAASLLVDEVPQADGQSRYLWGRVASATAKYWSGRPFPVTASTQSRIRAYCATTRASAVRTAQLSGAYSSVDRLIVRDTHRLNGGVAVFSLFDERDELVKQLPLDRLTVNERARLYFIGRDGPEPMWLWLSEDGLPFQAHSWEQVFASGTRRCERVLGEAAPRCTPHMARHSFALTMLVALHHVLDKRFGLDPQQRRDYEQLYGDPWRMVKDLLGHKSVETTRDVYLAPLRDVTIRSLLEGDMDQGTEFLRALAAISPQVQDVRDV